MDTLSVYLSTPMIEFIQIDREDYGTWLIALWAIGNVLFFLWAILRKWPYETKPVGDNIPGTHISPDTGFYNEDNDDADESQEQQQQ